MDSVGLMRASILVRDDNGPTGKLGAEQWFIRWGRLYYPVSWLESVPGIRPEQLTMIVEGAEWEKVVKPNDRNPYLVREQMRQQAKDDGVKYEEPERIRLLECCNCRTKYVANALNRGWCPACKGTGVIVGVYTKTGDKL